MLDKLRITVLLGVTGPMYDLVLPKQKFVRRKANQKA